MTANRVVLLLALVPVDACGDGSSEGSADASSVAVGSACKTSADCATEQACEEVACFATVIHLCYPTDRSLCTLDNPCPEAAHECYDGCALSLFGCMGGGASDGVCLQSDEAARVCTQESP